MKHILYDTLHQYIHKTYLTMQEAKQSREKQEMHKSR